MNQQNTIILSVLGGLSSAALFLLGSTYFFLLGYFVTLPLFLVGLSLGKRPLYLASLIATAPILIFENYLYAFEFVVLLCLAMAFLTSRALLSKKKKSGEVMWYPSSFLLRDAMTLSGFILLVALGAYLYFTQDKTPQAFIDGFLALYDPKGQLTPYKASLISMFTMLPGIYTVSWIVNLLINASIAQGILVHNKRNIRPSLSLRNLEVSTPFAILLAISIALAYVGVGSLEILGKNAALVLIFPYLLIGFGYAHTLAHRLAQPRLALTLFYIAVILFLWPLFFVAALGILKPFLENILHHQGKS